MVGMESMEWYQTHQTHGFRVFDTIPFTPTIIMRYPPSAASCDGSLRLRPKTQPFLNIVPYF